MHICNHTLTRRWCTPPYMMMHALCYDYAYCVGSRPVATRGRPLVYRFSPGGCCACLYKHTGGIFPTKPVMYCPAATHCLDIQIPRIGERGLINVLQTRRHACPGLADAGLMLVLRLQISANVFNKQPDTKDTRGILGPGLFWLLFHMWNMMGQTDPGRALVPRFGQ